MGIREFEKNYKSGTTGHAQQLSNNSETGGCPPVASGFYSAGAEQNSHAQELSNNSEMITASAETHRPHEPHKTHRPHDFPTDASAQALSNLSDILRNDENNGNNGNNGSVAGKSDDASAQELSNNSEMITASAETHKPHMPHRLHDFPTDASAQQLSIVCAPSKVNVNKPANPARAKPNQQFGTEPGT